MKILRKAALPLVLIAVVAALLFGGRQLFPGVAGVLTSGRAPAKTTISATQDYAPVVAGKSACGLTLGATMYDVVAERGHPQVANGRFWGYGRATTYVGDEAIKVYFREDYSAGGAFRLSVVQCFLPSRLKTLTTSKSKTADVVAVLGQPDEMVYWDDSKVPKVKEVLYIYGSLGVNVVILTQTDTVVGFIIYAAEPKL